MASGSVDSSGPGSQVPKTVLSSPERAQRPATFLITRSSRNFRTGTEQPLASNDELAALALPHGVVSTHVPNAPRQSSRKRGKCRYFATKRGCRVGAECPYIHDASTTEQKAKQPNQQPAPLPSSDSAQNLGPSLAAGVQNLSISGHAPSHGAQPQRPVSKIEQKDPREFQINQLRRRFRPEEKTDEKGVTLSFGMAPSDPDFPFELDKLQCVLHVPVSYPSAGRPTLSVTNPEMEAAYRVNVGRGFDDIVDYTLRSNGQGTLLSWMNSLDKQLERLLITLERGPKLTFVANVGQAPAPREQKPQLMPTSQHELPQSKGKAAVKVAPAPAPVSKAPIARKTHTATEKSQAEKRRSMEIKQLEARLGRLPMFQKRTDTSWIVPIQPNKVDRLPRSLQTIKTVKLLVPQLYPLELSSIEIQANDSPEARSVETGFTEWVEKNSQMNLVSQVNYLASNMHAFAKTPLPEVAEYSQHEHEHVQSDAESSAPEPSNGVLIEADGDRPHLHVIPRPPEWSVPDSNSDSEITDESSYDEEYSEEEEGEDTSEGGAPVPAAADDTPGRGVALSFPFMELYGIELLELVHLAITVKCERCKQTVDIKNVPQIQDPKASPRIESCRKCANSMSIGFRRQMMHSHANRAGYLDLEGCIIVDLIPSNFLPTCSECSTVHPMPGVSAVRGESAMAICRHCHRKMVFKLPEVKFLVVGTAGITSRALPLKKKPREVLGIVAGQELPRRGRCQHYSKSHRWFRFSCCAKVFPCDKCHDADTDHPNEHANRMICGFCSREQIYRPENCGICKAVLVGKAGSGFWEGGKGTRNRALMSRKDPRKYKRRGGNPPGGSSSKKK
ncbi:UNC93-like protein [Penicillium atrosanguineum]|uniref:Zinc finger CCCH-type n=1 Tax=Penicillium atrosanguineum TaxID=1132637 RepID=A0A9W9PP21_9EURO|nr:UNC93-like protein [Penicillium atrosanguineum]KAJ5292926.1 UNC93-like protein [Penicillium atrosanguineum]KAJ5303036.1 Zinc finger CCCH-type [Penicillium atrosanguineum]